MGSRRSKWLAAVVVLLSCLISACGLRATGNTQAPGAATSGTQSQTTVDVQGRPLTVYVPDSPPRGEGRQRSLLIVLHGHGSSPEEVASFFGLPSLALKQDMVIGLPEGTVDSNGERFWNASRACCDFDGSKVNDSDYLAAVVDLLVQRYNIDPTRVFVAGHSNGGFMALRFACDHPQKVAALVSVAGAMDVTTSCTPAQPVSILLAHGDADTTVAFGGGDIKGNLYTSADQTADVWRRANGCPVKEEGTPFRPIPDDPGGFGDIVSATSWTGCNKGTEVVLWRMSGVGHQPAFSPAVLSALLQWLLVHARIAS